MFDQSLSDLYIKLSKKEQELADLQNAVAKLVGLYEDFAVNESLCVKPSLSPKTLHGMNASGFERHREFEVLEAFKELKDDQLANSIQMVAHYIEKTQEEIENLQNKIATLEAEAREKAQNK